MSEVTDWYKGATLYQIYPRSFQDSNGDGIGDLNGIRHRLDYLNDLGIDCVWISPFYPSPMKDFGYDINDYCDVDPVFGSLQDFKDLLTEAHALGIKVLIDLVPNHTSDENVWFKESRKSRDNTKQDWYVWRDAKPDGSPPNNWLAVFGGKAWEWCEERQQYYLHSFLKEQPDLNWENPDVQDAMAEVMRFWLNLGVDGFRVDAIDLMGKDLKMPDEPTNKEYDPNHQKPYYSLEHKYSRDAGNFFAYLRFMTDVVAGYENRLLILESYILERHKPELYWRFYRKIDRPFCLPFNFELIFMEWSASEIQKFIDAFQAGLHETDQPIYALGNHDQSRFVSRAGSYEAARAGALLLFSLPGIGLVYNGEEIGMHNVELPSEIARDADGRDTFRTPMQWSAGENAGFSSATPWLPIATDYEKWNVENESADPASMLNFYKALIALRHRTPALKYGTYSPGPPIEHIVSFFRKTANESLWVLVNFCDEAISILESSEYELVISSRASRTSFDGKLLGHEAVVLRQRS